MQTNVIRAFTNCSTNSSEETTRKKGIFTEENVKGEIYRCIQDLEALVVPIEHVIELIKEGRDDEALAALEALEPDLY